MAIELGAHVGQENPLAEAAARGADVVQFFLGDPQSFKGPKVAYPGGAEQLKADAEQAGVGLYIHAPYLINVATTNNRIRIPSRKLMQQQLSAAALVGARGLIVHAGHVGSDEELAAGFDNWRKAIDRADLEVPLLIENTAGGNHAMARYLESIARLWDALDGAEDFGEVGFCLDTCHAHAAGEDLSTIVDRVKAVTGRIDLVHVNNSRDAAGSGADRHAGLASGQIDPELLAQVVRDAGTTALVETPGSAAEHAAELVWLRDEVAGQH